MSNEFIINKGRAGLYSALLERIYFSWKGMPGRSKKEYLPYKDFRKKIPKSFQITKEKAWEQILILADIGLVSIEKRGIKLNYRVVENEQ